MFTHTNQNEALLEENIEAVLKELKNNDTPGSESYAETVDQLTKLYAIKHENRARRVSPDTMATIAAHLIGIGFIVGYERTHIITSKALGFVKKVF